MGKSSYPSHESKKESRMFSPVKGNEWGKRSCQPLDRSIGIGGKALNEKMRRLYPLGIDFVQERLSSCDLKVSFSMRSKSHIHY